MTVVEFAVSHIGCPYIFGAREQICTPSYRQSVMTRLPGYASKIKLNCPVLSGKQKTCAGCKYNGKPSYDCRGFTSKAVEAATGRAIQGAGCTSQWNDASNWVEKGLIKDKPNKVTILFRAEGSSMPHTGIDTNDGYCIHASGHNTGVIRSKFPLEFTHYAVPVGTEKPEVIVPALYQATVKTVNPLSLNIWKATDKKVSLTKIPNKATVDVLAEVSAVWATVKYGGFTGYVDRQYLVKIPPVVVPPSTDTVTIPRSSAQALYDLLGAALK